MARRTLDRAVHVMERLQERHGLSVSLSDVFDLEEAINTLEHGYFIPRSGQADYAIVIFQEKLVPFITSKPDRYGKRRVLTAFPELRFAP